MTTFQQERFNVNVKFLERTEQRLGAGPFDRFHRQVILEFAADCDTGEFEQYINVAIQKLTDGLP